MKVFIFLFSGFFLLFFYMLVLETVLLSLSESQKDSLAYLFFKKKILNLQTKKKEILEYFIKNRRNSVAISIVIAFVFSQFSFFFNLWALGLLAFAIGLAILVIDLLLFVENNNFIKSKEISLKTFASGMQEYIKETQLWFFIVVITWATFFTLKVYSFTFIPAIFAIFLFSILYIIFLVFELKEIPILRFLIITAFICSVFSFAFANSFWNSFFLTCSLFLFFAFKNSPIKKKADIYITKLNEPQKILYNHYKIELFLFKVLKDLTLGSLTVLYKVEFLLNLDIIKTLGEYSSFYSETFVVFRFLIFVSLFICSLLDIFVFTSFNDPVNPDISTAVNAGAAVAGVVVATAILVTQINSAEAALDAKALSTEVNPGPGEDTAKRQEKLQGFISESKEGNRIGAVVKQVAGHPPFTHPDNKIDLSLNVEYLQKGLKTKADAAAAEYLTGLKCTSKEEQGPPTEEEINRVIKHLESKTKEKDNPSVIAQAFPEYYKKKSEEDCGFETKSSDGATP